MEAMVNLLILAATGIAGMQTGAQSWEQIRTVAEAQHEIVMLLIKNKEFSKVLPASKKIFSLQFPPEHQHLLVEEAKILTDSLLHHNQFELAHQILDMALESVKSNKLKVHLYKEKAYVCVKEGRDEEAKKLFEKVIELEKGGP